MMCWKSKRYSIRIANQKIELDYCEVLMIIKRNIFGRSITNYHQQPIRLLKIFARQGHAACQATLGVLYLQGIHVNKNRKSSRRWLLKAAAQNYKVAWEVLKSSYLTKEAIYYV